METKEAIGLKEVAKMLGVSKTAVYRLSKQPGFPVIRIGERNARVPLSALRRWMDEQSAAANRP